MSLVAEFAIPPEALPFGETLIAHPGMRLEVDRVVPTGEFALPFFWVWGNDPDRFIEASTNEPEIRNARLLERIKDGALFRAEWTPNPSLVDSLRKLDAVIIEGEATAEGWRFQIRAEQRRRVLEFERVFTEQGITISLTSLYDLAEVVEKKRGALTTVQRDTLISAYQEGYYESPRNITQEGLGELFDVSHHAISERLRRGTRNLIVGSLNCSGEDP